MYRLYRYGGKDHTNAGEDHTNGRRAEGMKAFRALDASLELGKLIWRPDRWVMVGKNWQEICM